jgi:hypothetical protein
MTEDEPSPLVEMVSGRLARQLEGLPLLTESELSDIAQAAVSSISESDSTVTNLTINST